MATHRLLRERGYSPPSCAPPSSAAALGRLHASRAVRAALELLALLALLQDVGHARLSADVRLLVVERRRREARAGLFPRQLDPTMSVAELPAARVGPSANLL